MHQPRTLASLAFPPILAFLLLLSPASAQQLSPALQNVPQSAPLAIYVPSLANLSRDVAALDQTMSLRLPILADVLTTIKQTTGFSAGIDDQGSLLAIVTDPAGLTGQTPEPPVVVLLPITSYEEFLKNFPAAPAEGAAQITMPNGQAAWARPLGKFVVIGPSKMTVENFTGGAGDTQWLASLIGPQALPYLPQADLALILNVPAVESQLIALLDSGLERFSGLMQMANAANPATAAQAGLAQTAIKLYADAARAWIRDTAGVLLAVCLDDKGFALTFTSCFEPDSPLAQRFSQPTGGSNALLDRLPNQTYFVAAAINYQGLGLPELLKQIVDELQASGDTTILPLLQGLQEIIQHSQAAAAAFNLVPMMAMMSGGNPLVGLSVTQADDPQALINATRDYYRRLAAMQPAPQTAEGAPTTQPPTPSFTSEYQENVLQLDGTPVDRFSLRIQPPPGIAAPNMGNLPAQEGYLAVAESFVVSTATPDIEMLRQGLAAVKAGNGLGTDSLLVRVRQEGLPEDPTFQAYLNTRALADTFNSVLAMMSAPPIDVPANLPPIGLAATLRDGTLVKRLFVPTAVLEFGGHAFQQIMAMQQQPTPSPEPLATPDESGEEPAPQPQPDEAPAAPF